MGGGPPYFLQDFSCPVVLWIQSLYKVSFDYRTVTFFGEAFQPSSSTNFISFALSLTSGTQLFRQTFLVLGCILIYPFSNFCLSLELSARFGLFPVRSPLLRKSNFSFSSSGYLDVSVPLVFPHTPMYSVYDTRGLL